MLGHGTACALAALRWAATARTHGEQRSGRAAARPAHGYPLPPRRSPVDAERAPARSAAPRPPFARQADPAWPRAPSGTTASWPRGGRCCGARETTRSPAASPPTVPASSPPHELGLATWRRPRRLAPPPRSTVVATQMLTNRLAAAGARRPRGRRAVSWDSAPPTPRPVRRPATPPRGRLRRPLLQHTGVSHRAAASGAIRVLEAPKPRLKAVERRLPPRAPSPAPAGTTRPGASGPAGRRADAAPTLTGASSCGSTSRRSSRA